MKKIKLFIDLDVSFKPHTNLINNQESLLQNIYNESQRVDKIVKRNLLTDETGDCGGVFVEIENVPVEAE